VSSRSLSFSSSWLVCVVEHIKFPAKLLDYFSQINESNINQSATEAVERVLTRRRIARGVSRVTIWLCLGDTFAVVIYLS